MEGMLKIGIGYFALSLPPVIVFIVVSARQKNLERRLDALVQMARISGDVVGVDQISSPLGETSSPRSDQRWGIVLSVTAVGVAIAGMLDGDEGMVSFAIAMAGLGFGLILAQIWSHRFAETPPKAAL